MASTKFFKKWSV